MNTEQTSKNKKKKKKKKKKKRQFEFKPYSWWKLATKIELKY